MTFAKTAAAALIIAAFPFAAFAQHGTADTAARLDQRDAALQQRIDAGIRDGSLTRREAAGLQSNQARIDRMEARAAADGRISRAERARITEAQNRQSAAIERERHNRQRATPATATPAGSAAAANTARSNNGNHHGQLRNGNSSASQSGPNANTVAQNIFNHRHNQR